MHCDSTEPELFWLSTQPGFNKLLCMHIMTMWSRKPDFFYSTFNCLCSLNLVLIFLVSIQYVNIFIIWYRLYPLYNYGYELSQESTQITQNEKYLLCSTVCSWVQCWVQGPKRLYPIGLPRQTTQAVELTADCGHSAWLTDNIFIASWWFHCLSFVPVCPYCLCVCSGKGIVW